MYNNLESDYVKNKIAADERDVSDSCVSTLLSMSWCICGGYVTDMPLLLHFSNSTNVLDNMKEEAVWTQGKMGLNQKMLLS